MTGMQGIDDKAVISVITPSYNQGRYLAETIESVLGQEGDFHLDYIIVDGGSTDNSVETIKRYERSLNEGAWQKKCRGIRYRWVSEKDKGQTDAIMKGFRMAEGEILAWLNSDDTYLPDALQKVAAVFSGEPEVTVIYGRAYYTGTKSEILGTYPTAPFDFRRLASFNFVCQPSTFFRKSSYESAGGLDLDLNYGMDYDLWIRLAKQFGFRYITEFLSTYRLHEESKTISSGHALSNHKEGLDLAIKYYHWAPLNRVYGYCNQFLRARLPHALGKFSSLMILLSVPFTIVKYLILNRGIRLDDVKMLNRSNLRKMLMETIDISREYKHE
jgi:glycosyltransferase involved in cell wall biosynthesis